MPATRTIAAPADVSAQKDIIIPEIADIREMTTELKTYCFEDELMFRGNSVRVCQNCGYKTQEDFEYCHKCGSQF